MECTDCPASALLSGLGAAAHLGAVGSSAYIEEDEASKRQGCQVLPVFDPFVRVRHEQLQHACPEAHGRVSLAGTSTARSTMDVTNCSINMYIMLTKSSMEHFA
jgi:hypothetical protein